MKYETKNFEALIGTEGFSDTLLKNHFTLYEGYVANFNKLNDILIAMEKEDKFGSPEFAELNRRFGWEFNGMRLHELYFGNISKVGKEINKNADLYKKIEEEWGSYDMWEKDFRSMGAMRGIGWVILYYDKESGRLFNVWVNEHDVGHLSGATPLLVMDVFEHAFLTDYGLKRADYIANFMKVIDWNTVESRLR
ncbi:MAG: Fe-Mn family superoxide dismutase [Parcubacteria group bacterium]|nr:Fe-Mn family superoxide dismutase [Parcubacteria group bacterium]MCR4342463.1 Fe-Mn family superoxide dismutase [Patescibacteria group bacterium]